MDRDRLEKRAIDYFQVRSGARDTGGPMAILHGLDSEFLQEFRGHRFPSDAAEDEAGMAAG